MNDHLLDIVCPCCLPLKKRVGITAVPKRWAHAPFLGSPWTTKYVTKRDRAQGLFYTIRHEEPPCEAFNNSVNMFLMAVAMAIYTSEIGELPLSWLGDQAGTTPEELYTTAAEVVLKLPQTKAGTTFEGARENMIEFLAPIVAEYAPGDLFYFFHNPEVEWDALGARFGYARLREGAIAAWRLMGAGKGKIQK